MFYRKNVRGSESLANIWSKKTEEEKLPAKADSLPRNIQLNDHIENMEKMETDLKKSVPEETVADLNDEEQNER